jgi:hypothetical protein
VKLKDVICWARDLFSIVPAVEFGGIYILTPLEHLYLFRPVRLPSVTTDVARTSLLSNQECRM